MSIIGIFTTVCFALLLIGFGIGFLRSWKKSLVRFGILLGSLILSIFISPVIAKSLMGAFVDGTKFVGFGMDIDFKEMVGGSGESEFMTDLFEANSTTTELATSLVNVVFNLVMFLLVFFAIALLSLIVYWIVIGVLRIKRKKANIKVEKNAKYWWLKVLGGGIGMAGMFVICFVILTPVFGVMSVCDKFLQDTKPAASAATPNSYICGELYYKDEKGIGGIEGYIEKYAKLRKEYNSSFIGKSFNVFGISKAGALTFNKLTNVTTGSLKINVTNELVALISTYNIYKENFVAKEFDITNNASVDAILEVYEVANSSKIVERYIEELVPKFCSRWLEGKKFLGIAMPISGELEPIARNILVVFNTSNATRIEDNVKAVVGVVKVANNNGLIKATQDGIDIIDFLAGNDTFVKDAVLQLSSTNELRHAMPNIMCDFTELIYNNVVGGEATFEEAVLTNEQIDQINWNEEAVRFQTIASSVLDVYNATKDNDDSSVMADQLANIGKAIDNAKNSALVSKPFNVFIDGFINSSNFNLDENVKVEIREAIDEHWTDPTFSFEKMFGTIQETIKVAQSLLSGNGSVDLNDLSGVLGSIIEDENVKQTIKDTISSDIISQVAGDDKTTQVMTDMLNNFIDNTTSETLQKDIAAGQEIVNLVNTAQNSTNKEFVLVGENATQEEKEQKADEIVNTLAGSQTVMDMLVNPETSAAKEVTQTLTGSDIDILKNSIETNQNLDQAQKLALLEMFTSQSE